MATLTHSRVCGPASDSFKVWVRASGSATATLEVRVSDPANTYVQVDSQSIDTGKYNTAVLTATGLLSATKYDYRVRFDGVSVLSYSTYTMPATGGRWILYVVADTHEDAVTDTIFNKIQADYLANYPTLPALILVMGDLIDLTGASTIAQRVDEALTQLALTNVALTIKRIPMIYTWDDWDFGGNNSCASYFPSCSPADITIPQAYWDYLFRDHPCPASPSYGYSYDIAGVPIIVPDSRSQKTLALTTGTASPAFLSGAESDVNNLWGSTQQAWLKSQMTTYRDRGLILFVSGTTMQDNRIAFTSYLGVPATRDSAGLFHRAARNDVFNQAVQEGLNGKVIILSGDDHRNCVWYRGFGPPMPVLTSGGPNSGGLNAYEFKLNSGSSAAVGSSNTVFGNGDRFEWSGTNYDTFLRFDLNPLSSGARTQARITYIHASGSQSPPGSRGIPTDSNSRLGDFYYRSGELSTYHAADGFDSDGNLLYLASGTQTYPPEVMAPQDNERAYVDAITGLLVKESNITRDQDWLLRQADDVDDPGTDDYRTTWSIRRERTWPEP